MTEVGAAGGTREPGLRFWLHYAEREGALTEEDGDRSLLVLPRSIQDRFGLGATMVATTVPDLAREEGAVLLIPGHPVLEAAATQVLEEGDVGTLWSTGPSKPPPETTALLAAAREHVRVEHGRLDPGGAALPRYAPVLRVGAQVTYVVRDRFYEREEVWVDGRTGLALPSRLERYLAAQDQPDERPRHLTLEPNLELAVRGAHARLAERASGRLLILARDSASAREDELKLAAAYYEAALVSNAERSRAASAARQHLLAAQAESTRREQARRLAEIREVFEPTYEIRPVRLHLIWVPAIHVPVVVRRGQRGFPFALSWWSSVAEFAPYSCPSCGANAPLVAARDRLGCRACLAPASEAPGRPAAGSTAPRSPLPAPAPPSPKESPALTEAAVQSELPLEGELASDRKAPSESAVRRSPTSGQPAGRFPRGRKVPPERPPDPLLAILLQANENAEQLRQYDRWHQRTERVGNKLVVDFWQAVMAGETWPRKRADPHSPLRVLYRLYGSQGPLRAVGVPPGVPPSEIRFATDAPEPGYLHSVGGELVAGGDHYLFGLHWRLVAGKAVVEEVLPYPDSFQGKLATRLGAASPPGRGSAPAPRSELDAVSTAIWNTDVSSMGLPFVVRCLAAWSRVTSDPASESLSDQLTAAALASLIGRRAGFDRTRRSIAADYGVDRSALDAAARKIQPLLRLFPTQLW